MLQSVRVAIALLVLVCSVTAAAARQVALVVGIDRYDNLEPRSQLAKARADARSVAELLGSLGFVVNLHEDVTRSAFNTHWQDFLNQLAPGDTAAFYFAGHGVELGGRNYLLPRDIPSVRPGRDELLRRESLSLQEFLADLREKGTRVNFVVLDACRDNPFEQVAGRSVGTTRGLAVTEPPEGTFIMFSAGSGESALDRLNRSDGDTNSVYMRNLLPLLREPGLSLTDVAEQVRLRVRAMAATVSHRQTPAYYNQVLGRVCLAGGTCEPRAAAAQGMAAPATASQQQTEAERAWERVRESRSAAVLEAFAAQFPGTVYAALARDRVAELTPARKPAAKTKDAAVPDVLAAKSQPRDDGKAGERAKSESGPQAAVASAPEPAPLAPQVDRARGCLLLGPRITAPVPVRKGSRLCAEAGNDIAVVKSIGADAIAYSVNGGYEISCNTRELCSFRWPEAPMFNVRVNADATAELISPKR